MLEFKDYKLEPVCNSDDTIAYYQYTMVFKEGK